MNITTKKSGCAQLAVRDVQLGIREGGDLVINFRHLKVGNRRVVDLGKASAIVQCKYVAVDLTSFAILYRVSDIGLETRLSVMFDVVREFDKVNKSRTLAIEGVCNIFLGQRIAVRIVYRNLDGNDITAEFTHLIQRNIQVDVRKLGAVVLGGAFVYRTDNLIIVAIVRIAVLDNGVSFDCPSLAVFDIKIQRYGEAPPPIVFHLSYATRHNRGGSTRSTRAIYRSFGRHPATGSGTAALYVKGRGVHLPAIHICLISVRAGRKFVATSATVYAIRQEIAFARFDCHFFFARISGRRSLPHLAKDCAVRLYKLDSKIFCHSLTERRNGACYIQFVYIINV